jgi:fibronectin type 3 domain-containing protein
MNRLPRLLSIMATLGIGASVAQAQAPPVPAGLEAKPTSSISLPITLEWTASPGASSYNIYRSTSAGTETAYATSTTNTYTDLDVTSGPIYFYEVAAVNANGTSALSGETSSKTPLPVSSGDGQQVGTAVTGGTQYNCEYAFLDGFDWFQALSGWFPETLGSSGSISPGQRVVDMAYSDEASMSFFNVQVPTSGLYNIDFRYAFESGLFPGVTNREMGLTVNGVDITDRQRFPITGSFDVYQDSVLQAHLNAGQNTIVQRAVTDHGLSRVDTLTVTAATASVPEAPTNMVLTGGNAKVTVTWTGSSGATSYNIYRGTKYDGEAVVPIATTSGSTTTYVDAAAANGTTYYYNVAAVNGAGVSPDSNQASVTPTSAILTSGPVWINCGGAAAAPFIADADFFGGTTSGTGTAIDTSLLTGTIPPQAVLQTNRFGNLTYQIGGLTAGASYPVTLYFAETYWTAAGSRVFNVSINDLPVLTSFDIFAAAGAKFKAVQRDFTATADSSGVIAIVLTAVTDHGQINGIVVGSGGVGSTPTATATAIPTATPTATARATATATATSGTATLLSQGHPATASSQESAGRTAANAVDGNTSTRWSSAFSDPQWIYVDLGATHTISSVVLTWETAYGKAYQIQTSNDAATWTTIYSTTTSAGGTQTLSVIGSGRYVRMYGTVRATQYGYSLWEFQVYGT